MLKAADRNSAGKKAAQTRKRRLAGRKAARTRKVGKSKNKKVGTGNLSSPPIMCYPSSPEQRKDIEAQAKEEFGPRGLSRFMIHYAVRRVRQAKAAILRRQPTDARAPKRPPFIDDVVEEVRRLMKEGG